MSHRAFAVALLSAALTLPFTARAEDAPAAAPAATAEAAVAPMPMMGMGMRHQMHGMAGDGMGQHCQSRMAMAGDGAPCMGGKCKRADGLEQRLDAMEKRLDMMQMMLEMLARQQGGGAR